jgi:hypothetical protein
MAAAAARRRWQLAVSVAAGSGGSNSDGWGIDKNQQSTKIRRRRSGFGSLAVACYLLKDVEISNIEEGRALNSWLIGLKF